MRIINVLAILCAAGSAFGQADEDVVIEVRVSSLGGGDIVSIDRGAGSELELDDLVVFNPLGGLQVEGVIVELEDRTSVVRLFDLNLTMSIGTRGRISVPQERFDDVQKPDIQSAPSKYSDDAWQEGMPLLAGIEAVDPAKRTPLFSGRNYFILDQTWTSDKGRKDSFYRGGTDLVYENPFGKGGRLQFDAEYTYRAAHSSEMSGQDFTKLRFDRASYLWGGDRFNSERREVGRFLLFGMPEFGVIDGFEFGQRLENGDRFGYSAGFLPEPTGHFESGHDAQVSAFYEWHPEEQDAMVVTLGVQRTFHSRASDRDLIVTKVSYQPTSGWDFHGTAWVDLYSEKDTEKPFMELTHLLAVANRSYGREGGMSVSLRHWAFPETERYQFLPVEDDQLKDDHSERVAWSGWKPLEDNKRIHGQVGLWLDEDEVGGDLEVGVEKRGLYFQESRADLTGFLTAGEFSQVAGLRASYDWKAPHGRWRVFYSMSNQEQKGFDQLDQLFQHWLSVSRDYYTDSGWSLNLRGETILFGDETSWSIGAYIQRSF